MPGKQIEILDCTIRDGGYYTAWDFDKDLVDKYLSAMQNLPVDIVEVGYRSTPQDEYLGKYFYLPDFALQEISRKISGKRLSIMLNEKSLRTEHIAKILNGLKPHISLIRLAIDPQNFDRAIVLAHAIKKVGFQVAFNLMYMSKYAQNDIFLKSLSKLNGLADYVNLVDSYGGMLPMEVKELIEEVKVYCQEKIGFHGHNNLELAFANALAAMDAGCDIVDATLMGMGRGAGNLKTELLLTHLVSKEKVNFDFNVLAGLLETWAPIHEKHQWGTNLPYMVSGANSLPQKDVMEWVTQRFYSFNSIIRALHNQKTGEADNMRLPLFKPGEYFENIIIIGGGPGAKTHSDAVIRFLDTLENTCIVHASSKNAKNYENVKVPQFFCLVGSEGRRMEAVFEDLENFKGQCVLPPYPRKMGTYIPEKVRNSSYELREVSFTDKYKDAHTALAIQTALDLKAKNIYLAGYDGYSNEMISPKEQALINENEYTFDLAYKHVRILSVLNTKYSIKVESVYSKII